MSDRILDKYLHRDADPHRPGANTDSSTGDRAATPPAEDAADDLGCFGWLRGVRDRAVMLELRKADGSIMAIGYAWLERAEFDPSEGITLHLAGRTVKIKGRNLNGEVRPHVQLFHGITRHRVPWIKQADEATTVLGNTDAPMVELIEW